MSFIETIRGFHWITKMVIALTAILLGLLLVAVITAIYWMSNQGDKNALNINQGFGMIVMSLAWILVQIFFVILIAIAIYMGAIRVKTWLEKYLDAMISRLDMLTEQKTEREATVAMLSVMNEKFIRMEKKLDNIEGILENVGE